MISVAHKVSRTYCELANQIHSPVSVYYPDICKQAHGNPSYNRPITFIEPTHDAFRIQKIYQLVRYHWWINVQTMNTFTEMIPIMSFANYFAKLLDPFMSGLAAGGQMDYISKLKLERTAQDTNRYVSSSEIQDGDNSKQMELQHLLPVRNIFLVHICRHYNPGFCIGK